MNSRLPDVGCPKLTIALLTPRTAYQLLGGAPQAHSPERLLFMYN
ncbi:MAG: hypothetical protein V7K92_03395 [Nostoc sp.]